MIHVVTTRECTPTATYMNLQVTRVKVFGLTLYKRTQPV